MTLFSGGLFAGALFGSLFNPAAVVGGDVTGELAATEQADTASFSGEVLAVGVSGVMTAQEDADAARFTGQLSTAQPGNLNFGTPVVVVTW